jgi:transcriptional regulator with XRE-family HTH domain
MFNSEKLLTWLDKKGITQYRFARLAGLEQSTISRIISGLVDPNSKTIARICQATGLSPNDLIIVPGDEEHTTGCSQGGGGMTMRVRSGS